MADVINQWGNRLMGDKPVRKAPVNRGGKIKGWKKNNYTGNIDAWVTTKRPYLNVWIVNIMKNYANDGLYEVNNDFTISRTKAFKTKQKALSYAYEIMKSHPNG